MSEDYIQHGRRRVFLGGPLTGWVRQRYMPLEENR